MKVLFYGVLLLLTTVANAGEDAGSFTITATRINFIEQEKNIEHYQTRVLLTEKFMRFDDGKDSDDFILFDRQQQIIYNVNQQDQTIMSIELLPVIISPPVELNQHVEKVDDMKNVPMINGLQPRHYAFFTNGSHCFDVVAVEGLLEDAVIAMREFNRILAANNADTLVSLPADMQTPCMLSKSIFAPNLGLEYGFPIREWDDAGKSRALVDYKQDQSFPVKLFTLPETYQRFSLKEFREGAVNQTR